MSSLPDEIYIDILLRLPVKSTLVCKCVCKNWYALISNPSFVKSHHNLTIHRTKFSIMVASFRTSNTVICSLSYDPSSLSRNEFHLYGVKIDMPLKSVDMNFRTMACCNGLACIWNQKKECFTLWNPDRKEYRDLPKSPNKSVDQYIVSCDLGYDHNAGDYKLICIYQKTNGVLVDIYVMGLNSWKNIQVIPSEIFTDEEPGVLVNGVFHWLGRRIFSAFEVIVSVNISSETFKEVQPPEEPLKMSYWRSVGVLNKCHCVVSSSLNSLEHEVWVMQDYGVQESWTRQYIITNERILEGFNLRPVWSFNSGEILFASFGWSLIDLVLYDPKDGSVREPNMHVQNQMFAMDAIKSLCSIYFSSNVG